MGKSLILAVKIVGDARDAIAEMDKVSGKSDGVGRALNTASKVAAVGLGAIAAGAVVAGKAASDLEQATGAVSSVFGEYAAEMMKHGEAAADAVGLSQTQYAENASVLGAQLKNMGISLEDTAGQTDSLITLGADLAATFGGSTSDAVGALSSLLRGERDPIEKYGVSIKQADIDAQKAAMGLDKLTGEAAKNADLQATLALLTSQTADAQGQFAREAGSAAGSAQIAGANFENAKAALGEALLPIMTEASTAAAELARWFQANAEWITPLIGVLGGLAAAIVVINGAYKAYAAIQAVQTAAQWAQNAAWLASPITWIVLAVLAAIALVVTAVVLVVKNWDTLKAKVIEVAQVVINWVRQIWDWTGAKVSAAIQQARATFAAFGIAVSAVISGAINWVRQLIEWVGAKIIGAVMRARNSFNDFKAGVVGVFQNIIEWVKRVIDWVANLASNAIPGWAKDLLGMSKAAAMPITPEVASLSIPDYRARMFVIPEASELAAVSYASSAPVAAPAATAASAFALPALPRVAPSSGGTVQVVEQNYNVEVNAPNYTGERAELVAWIQEALRKSQEKREGILYA